MHERVKGAALVAKSERSLLLVGSNHTLDISIMKRIILRPSNIAGTLGSILLLALLCVTVFPLEAATKKRVKKRAATTAQISRAAKAEVASGSTIGMQILIGRDGRTVFSGNWGKRGIADARTVDGDTMFCIGSCSKPVASTVVLALADRKQLTLNQTIDTWLPDFGAGRLDGGGRVTRAPTLRELLSHRGGIYSQKRRIIPAQAKLLYRFDHTLEHAVTAMARYPYISEPGTDQAYSGAGYCVLGRVAEVAAEKEFDGLLQETVCEPLGMRNTSYFPERISENIAAGVRVAKDVAKQDVSLPHLTDPHKMQLIGGSLYSTAEDLARLARMIAGRGQAGGKRVLSRSAWGMATAPGAKGSNYGLGWMLNRAGGQTVAVSHSGALFSARALVKIHIPSRSYLIVLRTVSYDLRKKATEKKSKGKKNQSAIVAAKGFFESYAGAR